MIARVTKGHGFAGLARYLENGRDDANLSDRVLWTEARNLPTDDPHTASVLMRATAAQSARTEKPVYHIALSFNPEDSVDRATMAQVADRLMNDLGLREHQALIIAHGDTRHPHAHLMINRVHPEMFRAWHPSHDYARVERSLREQERELGFRAVSGRHYRLDGQERPDQPEALAMNGDHPRPREQTSTEQAPQSNEANERQTQTETLATLANPPQRLNEALISRVPQQTGGQHQRMAAEIVQRSERHLMTGTRLHRSPRKRTSLLSERESKRSSASGSEIYTNSRARRT